MKILNIDRINKTSFQKFCLSLRFSTLLIMSTACSDFVEIDPPRTELIISTVFANDATANAAMMDIYFEMSRIGFASGNQSSFSYLATYSSDEQLNYSTSARQEFNDNELSPANSLILSLWSEMYKAIYKANAIIEGVSKSQGVSEKVKAQLEGEAKFIRAFCHFYLVNLFGDVPLVITTDYRTNSNIPRTSTEEIYEQIVDDLIKAKSLLLEDYSYSNHERVRINKWTATALLARAYLYEEDWENAELEATAIIDNTSLYSLVSDLNLAFRKNSSEAIWQFHSTFAPNEFSTFRVTATGPNTGAFRDEFVSIFEAEDVRRIKWIRSITNSRGLFYFPGKYKSSVAGEDYSTIFRLAEIYLIRAEARAHQDKVVESQDDLNAIRNRAELDNTTAVDRSSLLVAIEKERIVELFTEWGHRWLDLKRTNRANDVLAPIKGSTWQSTDVLYPIPEYQILNDPAMRNAQNPGY